MAQQTQTPFSAGISPLDEAHGKRLAGDNEGALHLATAVLEAEPEQLGAASLIARLLVEAGRPFIAGEMVGRLVDGFIRRGDLPAAVVAARVADAAGEDGSPHRRMIAEAFGKGSPRLGDVSPAPPPLPTRAQVTPRLSHLGGEQLLDRAENALQALWKREDSVAADTKVPELPLFSALQPQAMSQLLEVLHVREAPEGGEVIRQGDEGTDAYVVVRGVLEVVRPARAGEERGTTLAALGPGSIFGEMALVSEAPRAASVVAVEPALMLAIGRDELEALARKEEVIGRELGTFCRSRMLSNLMRHGAILRQVSPQERTRLIERFETFTFDPGASLTKSGEETEGLYLIASGGVEVMGRDAGGDQLRIAELGPGDVVGEISLVLRRPANADVIARHPTVTMRLKREDFQQAIREHPGLLNELYDIATKREEETRSVVGTEALDAEDVVLV